MEETRHLLFGEKHVLETALIIICRRSRGEGFCEGMFGIAL